MHIPSYRPLDSKLERLIVNHPVVSVRGNFYDEIKRGDIRLQYKTTSCSAMFSAMLVDGQPMKVLTIDPVAFMSSLKTDIWWMLVIFHESVHERQYRMHERDPRVFDPTYQPRDSTEYELLGKEKWYAEREAYLKECWLAKKMGAQRELGGLCELAGTTQFDRKLAGLLAANETNVAIRAVFTRIASLAA